MASFEIELRRGLACLFLAAALDGAAFFVNGASSTTVNDGTATVLVEILEGVRDKANWDFDPPKPSESYTESAFGFASMPTRYSSKAIKVDRSAPFVLRASAR